MLLVKLLLFGFVGDFKFRIGIKFVWLFCNIFIKYFVFEIVLFCFGCVKWYVLINIFVFCVVCIFLVKVGLM